MVSKASSSRAVSARSTNEDALSATEVTQLEGEIPTTGTEDSEENLAVQEQQGDPPEEVVIGEGANLQGEAALDPAARLALFRAKEEFNRTANAQSAQKSIYEMVAAAGREKYEDKNVPAKAKQYLELCAAQETVALEWFESNGGQGIDGADSHIRNFRAARAGAYQNNEMMRAVKLHLVNVLRVLRLENKNDERYHEAGARTPFPVAQDPLELLRGMIQLRNQQAVASMGDPLKERTLSLARDLVKEENNHLSAVGCRAKLDEYFLAVNSMEEKEEFAAEFFLLMASNANSNASRVWLSVLNENGVLRPNGTMIEDGPYTVLQLIEIFQAKVYEDELEMKHINDRWRTSVSGTHKRGGPSDNSGGGEAKKKKGNPPASGSGAGGAKHGPQEKTTCWVCGRRHEGKCAWFAHPDKGTKNVPWASSEAGKRQIEHKVAATQGALQVLNVYKHWTGTKHEDYSKEEVDRLKI